MWESILLKFSDSPSQTKIVKYLIENGFGVNESGKVICNGVEIPATHLGKAAGSDRRVVDATAKRILADPDIRDIFLNMRATQDLTQAAGALGLVSITIHPRNAGEKGIVGAAVSVLSKYGISIRQIFVTDSRLSEDPKLVIIVEKHLPSEVFSELQELPQVKQVTISK